jgi:hypothetical protein
VQLHWGIDVPVEGAEGKNYTFVDTYWIHISATGQAQKEKLGTDCWKIKTQNWFTLLGRRHCISLRLAAILHEGSYICHDNVYQ